MLTDEQFMARCILLAKLGAGSVAPNPLVGAVLVYNGRIIGEGYHQKYGGPHAEVNCIDSVVAENRGLISQSILYVSLEPCSHVGKTGPCTNLIIDHQIKKVIIGCRDIYKEVDGKGILQLKNAGVEVKLGILENECWELNKRFFTFHQKKRPYIILKWAQSANAKIGSKSGERILVSNDYSNRMVHRWRSEEAAILVGTHTALKDDPSLTTRLWKGNDPIRVIIDNELKLPPTLKLFENNFPVFVFNKIKTEKIKNIQYVKIGRDHFLPSLLNSLYQFNIQSVLVEGGAITLQSFIDAGLWDEARVIFNKELIIHDGVNAPQLKDESLQQHEFIFDDVLSYYKRKEK